MSHRGLIVVRQPDGRYSRTDLNSCSYPASAHGFAAGEILLEHHSSYPQALALSRIPAIAAPQVRLADMLPPNGPPARPRASLEECVAEAESDIHIEDLYIHDGHRWQYLKPRHGQGIRPLEEVVPPAQAEERAQVERNMREYEASLKTGAKNRNGSPRQSKMDDILRPSPER